MATRKEETFSKERIKAEMNEAKWGSVGLGFVAGILALIAISFTVGATSLYVSQEVGGIAFLLWIITLALVYGAWKYDQRYKKWGVSSNMGTIYWRQRKSGEVPSNCWVRSPAKEQFIIRSVAIIQVVVGLLNEWIVLYRRT